MNGSIVGVTAWARSIRRNVGVREGGAATMPLAKANRCTSTDPVTSGAAAIERGR